MTAKPAAGFDALIDEAKRAGFILQRRGNKAFFDTSRGKVWLSLTSHDHRAVKNARAYLRRCGLPRG